MRWCPLCLLLSSNGGAVFAMLVLQPSMTFLVARIMGCSDSSGWLSNTESKEKELQRRRKTQNRRSIVCVICAKQGQPLVEYICPNMYTICVPGVTCRKGIKTCTLTSTGVTAVKETIPLNLSENVEATHIQADFKPLTDDHNSVITWHMDSFTMQKKMTLM